jgi:hypothetical protein
MDGKIGPQISEIVKKIKYLVKWVKRSKKKLLTGANVRQKDMWKEGRHSC